MSLLYYSCSSQPILLFCVRYFTDEDTAEHVQAALTQGLEKMDESLLTPLIVESASPGTRPAENMSHMEATVQSTSKSKRCLTLWRKVDLRVPKCCGLNKYVLKRTHYSLLCQKTILLAFLFFLPLLCAVLRAPSTRVGSKRLLSSASNVN